VGDRRLSESENFRFTHPVFAPNLSDVSHESTSTNDGSHGAPSTFSNQALFSKKKAKKDSIGNLLMFVGILGILACLAAVVMAAMGGL
jgi:hypothetical protein